MKGLHSSLVYSEDSEGARLLSGVLLNCMSSFLSRDASSRRGLGGVYGVVRSPLSDSDSDSEVYELEFVDVYWLSLSLSLDDSESLDMPNPFRFLNSLRMASSSFLFNRSFLDSKSCFDSSLKLDLLLPRSAVALCVRAFLGEEDPEPFDDAELVLFRWRFLLFFFFFLTFLGLGVHGLFNVSSLLRPIPRADERKRVKLASKSPWEILLQLFVLESSSELYESEYSLRGIHPGHRPEIETPVTAILSKTLENAA